MISQCYMKSKHDQKRFENYLKLSRNEQSTIICWKKVVN